MKPIRVCVVGLDGCSWELLDPWIRQGDLPALQYLKEEAAWGVMESCLPPVTSPNWKCYSTGKNPGKLGIFWWENVDFRGHRVILPSPEMYDSQEIWDYLGQAGKKVVIINMPTTHPPKKVNGVLIAGGPDALDSNFTYPYELEQYLKREFGYRVHPRDVGVIDTDPETAAEQILPLLDMRFLVAEYLLEQEKPDFMHLTIYYINVLQHHLWDHPLVLEAWKRIDRNLAALRTKMPDWTFIFMVDHGTNRIRTQFNINTWLQQEGYLVLRRNLYGLLPRLGLSRECLVNIATRLGLKDWLKTHMSVEARASLADAQGTISHAGRAGLIDWERSRVVPSGQGPIYINPDLPEQERERLRSELRSKLLALRDDLEQPVVRHIYRKEEIYSGSHLDSGPDLVIDQADGVHISASIGSSRIFQRPVKWLAENHKLGLFAATGPEIVAQALAQPVHITDIAPTILHLYGLSVPHDMDGSVLRSLFAPESEPAQRETRYQDSGNDQSKTIAEREAAESQTVEDRLRALGYL